MVDAVCRTLVFVVGATLVVLMAIANAGEAASLLTYVMASGIMAGAFGGGRAWSDRRVLGGGKIRVPAPA